MLRFSLVATLAACGFSGRAMDDDPTSPDGRVPDGVVDPDAQPGDGPIDLPPPIDIAPCTVAPAGPAARADVIGDPDGGTVQPVAACDAGQIVVGIAFDTTVALLSNHADQNAVTTVFVHCGTLSRDAAGGFVVTPGATKTLSSPGTGNCGPYAQRMRSPDVMCPANSVLAGLTGNRIDATLYNSMFVTCAALDISGAATGPRTSPIAVDSTGAFSNNVQTSTCPAGTAAVAAEGRAVCGQDMIALRCAPLTCQ